MPRKAQKAKVKAQTQSEGNTSQKRTEAEDTFAELDTGLPPAHTKVVSPQFLFNTHGHQICVKGLSKPAPTRRPRRFSTRADYRRWQEARENAQRAESQKINEFYERKKVAASQVRTQRVGSIQVQALQLFSFGFMWNQEPDIQEEPAQEEVPQVAGGPSKSQRKKDRKKRNRRGSYVQAAQAAEEILSGKVPEPVEEKKEETSAPTTTKDSHGKRKKKGNKK